MKTRWNSFLFFMLFGCSVFSQPDTLFVAKDTIVQTPSSQNSNQDIFDYAHSKKFAEYLYKTGQFDYAIEEFQRVVFLHPEDEEAKFQIITAYLKKEDFFNAAGYFYRYYPVFDTLVPKVQKAGIVAHLFLNELDTAEKLLTRSRLDSIEKQTWRLGIYLLKKEWNKAGRYYQTHLENPSTVFHQFGTALNRRLTYKTKSPFWAGLMSAMVPGLGKVYTKNYGDALIAFLFTGMNAWQSYRGFQKDGINSTRGWIFGVLGAGFYLGNIYGSAKSAKKYNKKIDDEIESEVKSVIRFSI